MPTNNTYLSKLRSFFYGIIKSARTTNTDDDDDDVDGGHKTVIGESNNSVTIIRKQRRTVISQKTNNVLSMDEPIEIKIEISSRACDFFGHCRSFGCVCANFFIITFFIFYGIDQTAI